MVFRLINNTRMPFFGLNLLGLYVFTSHKVFGLIFRVLPFSDMWIFRNVDLWHLSLNISSARWSLFITLTFILLLFSCYEKYFFH
jgi:hypothetical protein